MGEEEGGGGTQRTDAPLFVFRGFALALQPALATSSPLLLLLYRVLRGWRCKCLENYTSHKSKWSCRCSGGEEKNNRNEIRCEGRGVREPKKGFVMGKPKKNNRANPPLTICHPLPTSYLNVHLHYSSDQDPKTLERLTIYLMETGRLLIQSPAETVALVFDLTQFGLSNMDYSLVQFLVKCFEAYYPESLGTILIHNAPLVFWGAWKIIEPWLDPVVASKIKFTYKDQDLLDLIPAEHLPDSFQGVGKDKYKYQYLAPVAGENDLMKDEATKGALLAERNALTEKYDAKTKEWIASGSETASPDREALAKELHTQYYKLEPYIRARSQYHRKNSTGKSIVQPDGTVFWTYNN